MEATNYIILNINNLRRFFYVILNAIRIPDGMTAVGAWYDPLCGSDGTMSVATKLSAKTKVLPA